MEEPADVGAACLPLDSTLDDDSFAWQYTVPFSDCNQAGPVDSEPDANGIEWFEYALYLNYVAAINPDFGVGNLQQLEQTVLSCRIPSNMQENAMTGDITIGTDGEDSVISDQVSDIELWTNIQLDVYQGGFDFTPSYDEDPITDGGTIGIGENVKLQINDVLGEGPPITSQFK